MNETTKEISRLLRLATDAEDNNDLDSARQLYERCLALDDGTDTHAHYPERAPVRLCAYLRYGWFLKDQADPRAALRLADRAVARWPNDSSLHSLIGRCHQDLDELPEAEAAYRRSLAIEPMTTTLSFLAQVLPWQDRDDESVVCLYIVLELDPNYEEAHYNLGCGFRLSGEYRSAIEHLRWAIEIDPDYAIAHAELGFALLLEARERGDEAREGALEHLKKAVALDPEYPWSRVYLANLLGELRQTLEARVHYAAALRIRPNDGFILAEYADFLSTAFGPHMEADTLFKKAIALAPEDDIVRFLRGTHLLRAKRYSEARRELLLADSLGHPRALEVLGEVDTEVDD